MTPELLAAIKKLNLSAKSVLEIGSYNVNGTARSVIDHNTWLGVDSRPGPDVDLVLDGAALGTKFGPIFDLVVCLETLEHCLDWRAVLKAAWGCTMQNGFLLLSTPGADFPRHDTPNDYQRFSLDIWAYVFRDHRILAAANIQYPHNGHWLLVQKSGKDINTDIETLPVP